MVRYLVSLLILLSSDLFSQDFNYTVSTSTETWQELNSQTILNTNNSAWNFSYKIPVGFTFNYLGRNFDSLTIETNGYIVFDADRNYALTTFLGFTDCVDSAGTHAVLGYELSGTTGDHILKIQFKNCGSDFPGRQHVSFQVWFYESNGKIEIRIGPGTFNFPDQHAQIVSVLQDFESAFPGTEHVAIDSIRIDILSFRIGLFNMNRNTEVSGYFLSGNPANPSATMISDEIQSIPGLNALPPEGMLYIFTPVSN